jgi:hypothetical protein
MNSCFLDNTATTILTTQKKKTDQPVLHFPIRISYLWPSLMASATSPTIVRRRRRRRRCRLTFDRLSVALSQQPRSTFYCNFVADALSILRPPECHGIRISVRLRWLRKRPSLFRLVPGRCPSLRPCRFPAPPTSRLFFSCERFPHHVDYFLFVQLRISFNLITRSVWNIIGLVKRTSGFSLSTHTHSVQSHLVDCPRRRSQFGARFPR